VEIRERAVRLVLEHQGEFPSQWAAISLIATKCGMTPETLRKCLRRADEILKAASAFFARELDPRLPR
jgi:transposase